MIQAIIRELAKQYDYYFIRENDTQSQNKHQLFKLTSAIASATAFSICCDFDDGALSYRYKRKQKSRSAKHG